MENKEYCPIGVFDSGYGGLTILKEIRALLPQYDYLYLGDNARSPYGTRSFDIINEFTTEAVRYLWSNNSALTILACNTASAKALRQIQQKVLPISEDPSRRVLGVIRPTAEMLENMTKTGHIAILATPGTVSSNSYLVETNKLSPNIKVNQIACPMWVPIVENGEATGEGADYFVKKHIDQALEMDKDIDVIVLACTHYPILEPKIRKYLPANIKLVSQGQLIANSLKDYLERHPEMEQRLSKGATIMYQTTECSDKFSQLASIFIDDKVDATRIKLN